MSAHPSSNTGGTRTGMMSGIYGGGPIYSQGTTTIPQLKASGFREVIVWNIAINKEGDLNFNYEFPLAAKGEYVGAAKYPLFASQMAALKATPSSVTRLTFSVGSSNTGVFQAIKALVEVDGTGPHSILYRNFHALKTAIPGIDAIDFDDENCYDHPSMVSFAVMLGKLGYEVSLCPYTNNQFWIDVATSANQQRPGTVTAVHLQCYSGGAGQSPCSHWNFGAVPVYPGLASDSSPADVYGAMAGWVQSCAIQGGFFWLFDDIYKKADLTQEYAAAINRAGK